VVPDLARRQAGRILRHPVVLLGVAWCVVLGVVAAPPATPYQKYSTLTGLVTYVIGPIALFASNLVASSDRRSQADEWAPSLPLSPVHRTVALLLACLAPAGLAVVLEAGVLAGVGGTAGLDVPLVWQHLASVPITVLGGAVLGVAVARLLPWPGAPLLVVIALIAGNVWVASSGPPYLGLYVDFAQQTNTEAIPAMVPGDPSWHLVYLLAFTGLAAFGAMLPEARRWWLPFSGGAVCGVVVLLAGLAQLP
jgi:hypothetical protein